MSYVDSEYCEADDSRNSVSENKSYKSTRMLLRDFLCKAKSAKGKSPNHCETNEELETPSSVENVEAENITEISSQTSVIKDLNDSVDKIKKSNNELLFQNQFKTQLSPLHTPADPVLCDNLKSKIYDLASNNNEAFYNNLSQNTRQFIEEDKCKPTSKIDFEWILNGTYNPTRNIYLNKPHEEDSLTALNLDLTKANKQKSACEYGVNFKNYNCFSSSDMHSSSESSVATSPMSLSESSPETPEPNSINLFNKKSRFLKKVWLDRHAEEDNSNSAESDYASSSEAKYPCKRTDFNPEINLYDTHDRNGILHYYESKIKTKLGVKFKNCRKLQFYNHFARSNIEYKKKNTNIITLDEAAINILEQSKKNTYNKILNDRTMNDICKNANTKLVNDINYAEKDCGENDKFQEDTFQKNQNRKDLKKFEYTFLQDGPCFQVAPKLSKCRECRWTQNQDIENVNNIFCRFYSFRKLRYTKNLVLATAGFSDPYEDPSKEDKELWLPNKENLTVDLDIETSHFILKHVGDQFCDLVEQEKQAIAISQSHNSVVAWKKLVRGVREMCDVCETTLFNVHWTCSKCGFIVCFDCYKHRLNDTGRLTDDLDRDLDEFSWLLCTNRTSHEPSKLMLTQIIPGDSLILLRNQMHKIRSLWNIQKLCDNTASHRKQDNVGNKDPVVVKENNVATEQKCNDSGEQSDTSTTDLEIDGCSALSFRKMLLGTPTKKMHNVAPLKQVKKSKLDIVSDIISTVLDSKADMLVVTPSPLKSFTHHRCGKTKIKDFVPTRTMTMIQSSSRYPDIPHYWLCDGKLLCLLEANHPQNYQIFQDQWKTGQPIVVANVSKLLDKNLWHPDRFATDFGSETNDLINCMNGKIVPNQPMAKFWEGFEHFSKRLKDEEGQPMLLKLKDWPPGEDFAELLPTRFQDLMKALPLGEYTKRDGKLNLASCLPDCFVKPDLGPKMYNAYGSALHPTKGTTNLHMDISDAVNIMVYVGIPKDGSDDGHIKEALRAIDEAGCDILTRRRVRNIGELPGALWHIYTASDADKIRDLLNKVSMENGKRLEPHHDPIHDQSWYLDGYLRERLYKEYGVEGYAIVQCRGDAIFIPAGAPHQVRNLHNCVKVAEDFVSPENISNCFHLTQEFRELSDTHTNHEDKLQIKNIIYHAVKEALTSMSRYLNEHLNAE